MILFDHAELFTHLDKGSDGFVKVFFFVGRGELDTDSGLPLRDHRIIEAGHEYSFLSHLGGELL